MGVAVPRALLVNIFRNHHWWRVTQCQCEEVGVMAVQKLKRYDISKSVDHTHKRRKPTPQFLGTGLCKLSFFWKPGSKFCLKVSNMGSLACRFQKWQLSSFQSHQDETQYLQHPPLVNFYIECKKPSPGRVNNRSHKIKYLAGMWQPCCKRVGNSTFCDFLNLF